MFAYLVSLCRQSCCIIDQDKTNAENNPPTFRAKPPTVLQKPPFIPQKRVKHTSGDTILSFSGLFFIRSEC